MKQRHLLILTGLLMAILLSALPWGSAAAAPNKRGPIVRDITGREYVANEVIVSFKSTGGPVIAGPAVDAGLQQLLLASGVISQRSLVSTLSPDAQRALPDRLRNLTLLTLADGSSVEQAVSALNASSAVYYAEPNYVSRVIQSVTPNDPAYSAASQWGLTGTYSVRPQAAWAVTTGSTSVKIAVIDTGIDQNHPDLAAKHAGGYDFVYGDSTPEDDHGHGTHVAGIAAASTNNGVGMAGVSWGSPVLSYKVCDANGACYNSAITSAVLQAANTAGVKVMNLSLGGQSACGSSYQDAFNYAYSKGITVVAAAGNDATSSPSSPAVCNHVIAVGSIASSGNLSGFSNYGSWVDVVAPGSSIYSAVPGGGYESWSGTSMASPMAAGVVALIYSAMGNDATATPATVDRVLEVLRTTARDLGAPGRDDTFAYGLVDAAAAVNEVGGPDDYEPDDSAAAANPIELGVPQGHSIFPVGDVDWVSFTLAAQAPVTLGVSQSNGDVSLGLYDAAEQPLACGPVGDTGYCTSDPLPAGTYFVRASETGDNATVQQYAICVSLSADCAPTIIGFSPSTARVGDTVTITGTNLVEVEGVSFNGAAALVYESVSAGQVTAVVPLAATTGKVSVSTLGGTISSADDLVIVPLPTISSFTPTAGPTGTVVTISGTNLDGATAVSFNGAAAGFSIVSATSLQATVPAGATSGPISVTAPGGTATSSASYLIANPDPYEPNETMLDATPLVYGDVVSDTDFHIPGDYDVFKFDGVVGERVIIDTDAVVLYSEADTRLWLYDASGSLVTYNDDENYGGGLWDSYIDYTLASTGVFYILVDDCYEGGGPEYYYTLKLTGYEAPPTISGFSPGSGPAGTTVTINGTNLDGVSTIKFNNTPTFDFGIISGTQLTATVPAGATSGKISVGTPDGTAISSGSFTVIQPPTISTFSPGSGAVGSTVTIYGANLSGATTVSFNGAAATITYNSSTQVRATVPAGATNGPISLTTVAGTATSSAGFTVLLPPTISSFSPTSGPVGTIVTISGTNLGGTTGVKFGSRSASFTQVSTTQLTAVVPSSATTGRVYVTTAGGTATSSTDFVVSTPPSISSFSPSSASVGSTVTIYGANLSGATLVSFNGAAATITYNSSTMVRVAVPAGATSGKISVTTAGGTATSSTNFTLIAGRPTISSFSPGNGAVGTQVTIRGTNFSSVVHVKFGTKTAAYTVISSTEIRATVPAGARSGKIEVRTAAGSVKSAASFTVIQPPVIKKFTPSSRSTGLTVAISGQNLAFASSVTFNGRPAVILSNTSSRIVTVVPAGATTGKISVTTPGGTAYSSTDFVIR